MNIKYCTLLAFSAFAGLNATAQDLTKKIPANADFVVTINNKAIVENSSMELLNKTLVKLGAFEQMTKNMDFPVKNLAELDFDLDKQAYIYRTNTDSLHYIGLLLPLKKQHQVKQHLFANFEQLPIYNGYERKVSKDGKTQVAWNEETLFVLTGDLHNNYFQLKEIGDRYGLDLGAYASASDAWAYDDALAAADSTVVLEDIEDDEEEILPDTLAALEAISEVETEVEEIDPDHSITIAADAWDYADADTIDAEDYDLESDSLYLQNQIREGQNDSIKNKLFGNWIASDFNNYLDPKNNMSANKAIILTDQKHLLRIWVPNLDKLYQDALPFDVLKMAYGFDMKNFKYGYQDGTFDLIQDQHTIKMTGTVGVDAEMAKIFKTLYSNKINKKFGQYIPENHLAYAAVNISTEGYLKQLPEMISRWYAPIAGQYGDIVTITATALEIGIDEKAIGKVMKGDHVFFLNDLQKVTKDYVTYEYDDDYNYKEVEKTKDEYVPNFLWMFTSQDQRLYKKILEFAVKKQEASFEKGIYKISDLKKLEPIYVLFKNDIVFVGSDLEQLTSIEQNRFKTNRNTKVKKDLFKYPFNLVMHTNAIPEVISKLEIPVTSSLDNTIKDLSNYGDLQIKSTKLNKNRFSGELSLELPNQEKNALQYILNQVIKNLDSNIHN